MRDSTKDQIVAMITFRFDNHGWQKRASRVEIQRIGNGATFDHLK